MKNEIHPKAVECAKEINRAAANFDELFTDKRLAEIIDRICFGGQEPHDKSEKKDSNNESD